MMRPTVQNRSGQEGAILGMVMVVVALVSMVGVGLLELAARDAEEASRAVVNTRAFWLAEAGVQRIIKRLYDGQNGGLGSQTLGPGDYDVALYDNQDPAYAIARGRAGTAERYVRVDLHYLVAPFESAVHGGNDSGTDWVFDLRGTGDPDGSDIGGRDIINGSIFVNGDFFMEGESEVNAAPAPNSHGLNGDVEATGSITVNGSASVAGVQAPGAAPHGGMDLQAMDYANNNTYNISQIFSDLGITSGALPATHPLHDVVVINPGNRGSECASTPGDDFFFEPQSLNSSGSAKEARTPLVLGDGNVYYVDGDVWFHSYNTYGFKVDGQATIVSSGNIHISDNLKYADSSDLLGLVAAGTYDAMGELDGGGDIYFGDPQFGTLYTADAFMFAGNNFLYNTRVNGGGQAEPASGFKMFGNFAAVNQVVVYRDWYKPDNSGVRLAAVYDHDDNRWEDAGTGVALSETEKNSIRHYQMELTYDERIWNTETQPPRLPRGSGRIFGGVAGWVEINAGDA